MDECIDLLRDARVLSTLDAYSGCWQVEVNEKDREKTAFTWNHELYRFVCMLFGFKNALRTFHGVVYVILGSLKWLLSIVYLDDLIIFSK